MTRTSRFLGIILVATALAVSAACGGGGGPATVKADAYAGDTCGDVLTWGNSLQAAFSDLQNVSGADFTDKAAAKKLLSDLSSALGDAGTATTKLIDSVNKRGAPDVKNGADLKKQLVTAFTTFRDLLSATRTKVNNFNVDTADEADASKFQDDMNKFGDDVNAALDGADTVQKDPGLKAAFDKDATCKELNSQFPDSSS